MVGYPVGFKPSPVLVPNEMANPIGTITLWSGSIGSIPAGFLLCDGNNGTPDLRDRFVQGAGGSKAVDVTGGLDDHAHTGTGTGHVHQSMVSVNGSGSGPAEMWDAFSTSSNQSVNINTDTQPNVPPFYALAYIMRVS